MGDSASISGGRLRRVGEGDSSPEIPTSALELDLSRIPSVTGVRVVTDSSGRVSEVHVLATPERAPKQIVRDVQSVALAARGIEVDYRKISVVQLGEPDPPDIEGAGEASAAVDAKPRRPLLRKLIISMSGSLVRVEVEIAYGEVLLQGAGTGALGSIPLAIAQSVGLAVADLLPGLEVHSEHVSLIPAGNRTAAFVSYRLVGARGEEVLVGAAPVRHDPNDAVARAALDALNRLFGRK